MPSFVLTHGVFHLLQAEAVSQLVNARTAAAADAALAGLSGGLASCVASVRAAAVDLLVN